MTDTEEVMSEESANDAEGDYLKQNGDFLFQTFSPLLSIYDCQSTLNILSEEERVTFSVGMMETDEPGVIEVNCVKFEPNQESPRACFENIF